MQHKAVWNRKLVLFGLLAVAAFAILVRGLLLDEPAVVTVEFYFIFVAYIVLFPVLLRPVAVVSSRWYSPTAIRPPPSR